MLRGMPWLWCRGMQFFLLRELYLQLVDSINLYLDSMGHTVKYMTAGQLLGDSMKMKAGDINISKLIREPESCQSGINLGEIELHLFLQCNNQ